MIRLERWRVNQQPSSAVLPQYHWTDQKIRVRTFICLVALLLCRLVERESRAAGYQGSLSSLLELLGSIRLALVL